MKAKNLYRKIFYFFMGVCFVWLVLTLVVEATGPEKSWQAGDRQATRKILIVFDPDPFYNLDEQVCRVLADELGHMGLNVRVASVAAANKSPEERFDAFVFCSNTYNWEPDWAISRYIKGRSLLGKPVVAITLGAGSTGASHKKLEELILKKQATIIGSRSLWLMRPNDETRTGEPNVEVALSLIREWAKVLGEKIQEHP